MPGGLVRIGREHMRAVIGAGIAALAVAAIAWALHARSGDAALSARASGQSPAVLTRHSSKTRHFLYVVTDHKIWVYEIDRHNRLVSTINVPQIVSSHGVVASPATGRLYVAFGGQGGTSGTGSLLAFNLLRHHVIWVRHYQTGIDSMAITPDGRTIYMPQGEAPTDTSSSWSIIKAASGVMIGTIHAGLRPHNTIMSPDGRFVYLGSVAYPYLDIASTATNKVVRKIGPLHGPGAGRPFTINGSQTLAFNTASSFLGFQVSSIHTGRVLYSAEPPGFSWNPQSFQSTPDHGISLSPDEQELYLIDTPNGYVHVFDVSGLPGSPPRDVANIKLAHPPPSNGWLLHSRNGHYVYVGDAGDVINTRTRRIVAFLPALQASTDYLEIDWRHGRPVSTTSRSGLGYVRRH